MRSTRAKNLSAAPLQRGAIPVNETAKPKKKPELRFSITGPKPSPQLVEAIEAIERSFNAEAWFLVHGRDAQSRFSMLNQHVYEAFFSQRAAFTGKRVVLILDSPGGHAGPAYKISSLLGRRAEHFVVVVPRYAKSAATLLALGAHELVMCEDAELGPLDVQIVDPDREAVASALDEVQALERLQAAGLQALDQAMTLLIGRTRKRVDTLLPISLKFVAETMKPLYENIDVVHYTQWSRMLKIAEEYAIRLLQRQYGRHDAERMARQLVECYPEHGFVIDGDEARALGLKLTDESKEISSKLDSLIEILSSQTILGRLVEANHEKANQKDAPGA
jgi:hypothetical protein